MAYGIVHHFPGGTKEQYEASIGAVHPSRDTLPKGQIFHAAGPSAGGWTIVAVHDSRESWEHFRDSVLMPRMKQGIKGGFTTPPQESAFELYHNQSMSAQDEVRNASQAFYSALNRMLQGDVGPMAAIWSHGADVTTMHPIGGREVGWGNVKTSFEQVARLSSGGQVHLNDQLIQAGGDLAYELGIERGHAELGGQKVSIEQRVTNIYRRESGAWKIVHHHTDVSAAMLDVVRRKAST